MSELTPALSDTPSAGSTLILTNTSLVDSSDKIDLMSANRSVYDPSITVESSPTAAPADAGSSNILSPSTMY